MALVVLGAAAALRLAFFSGMVLYDDYHYAFRAWQLAEGHFEPPVGVFSARVGLVGPTALVYAMFGVSRASTSAFPFACSMGSVVATYLLGRRLWDDRVALFASLFVAIFPLDVIYAGELFGTTPETFFVGTGLGLFLLAERESRPKLYAASGVCLGAAALVHETALVALIYYPVYSLIVARPAKRQAWFLCGLVSTLAIDPLVHGLMGSPGAHFVAMTTGSVAHGTSGETSFRGFNVEWLGEPILRFATEQELGLFPLLLAPLALWRLWQGRRGEEANGATHAVALYLVVVGLWLLYGSVSPLRYAPLGRLPRYLAGLVLPCAWLLASELCDRRGSRVRMLVTAGLVLTSFACVVLDGGRARLGPYQRLKDAIAASGANRVHVERAVDPGLRFAEGFRPRYELLRLEGIPQPGELAAVESPEGQRRFSDLPAAEMLATIGRPDTVYTKVLRTRLALAVLSLTRPDYRMRDLQAKAQPWALVLYRMRGGD